MIRAILFFFIAFFSSYTGHCQRTLTCTIQDAQTGDALIGANIVLCDQYFVSDGLGQFKANVSVDFCEMVVSYVGYQTYTDNINMSIDTSNNLLIFLHETEGILDQAVITASKFDEKASNSSVSLQILNSKALTETTTPSIDAVLDRLPGVDVIDGQANIRGGAGYSYGAGSRVLLVLDGIQALQFDGGYPNWDDMPVESVERVEVLKGASSVLYGSSALNGVIHVQTKKASLKPSTTAGAYYKHFMRPKDLKRQWWKPFEVYEHSNYLTHTRKVGKLDVHGAGMFFNLKSFNKDTEKKRGRARLGLRYRPSSNLILGMQSQLDVSDNSSFFYWGNALRKSYQPNEGVVSEQFSTRIKIDPSFTWYDGNDNRHLFRSRFAWTKNNNSDDRSILSTLTFLSYNYLHDFESWNSKWIVGTDVSYNTTKAELYGFGAYWGANTALYTEWTQQFFNKRLKYNLGVRYEINHLYNPAFDLVSQGQTIQIQEDVVSEQKPVFRGGLNAHFGKATYLRASIGQGYRYPTIAEKFTATQFGSFNIVPNPNLESETGWSSEIGIRQEMSFNVWDYGSLQGFVDVAGFRSQYFNMMEFGLNKDLFFQASNVGDTQIDGVDISSGWQAKFGLLQIQGLVGYTYIDPIFQDFTEAIQAKSSSNMNVLKYRYKHSLKSNFKISIWGVDLGVNQRYNSHMLAIDQVFNQFISGIEDFRMKYNKGYNVFNMYIDYTWDAYTIGLHGENLTNIVYTERPGLLEAPRSISVQFKYKQ